MASHDDYLSELNKLNKNKLIEIIINKRVPEGVIISENLRKHLNSQSEEGLFDVTADTDQPNLENNIQVIKLKSEIEILKTKLDSAKLRTNDLLNINEHQRTIIELQESVLNVNKSKRPYSVAAGAGNSVEATLPVDEVPKKEVKRSTTVSEPAKKVKSSMAGTKIIKGTDTTSPLASYPKKAWIYVGRARLGTTSETVIKHLENKFPTRKFTAEALPVRDSANICSFKVSADLDMLDELYREENWPANIIVKRFVFFRSQRGHRSGDFQN